MGGKEKEPIIVLSGRVAALYFGEECIDFFNSTWQLDADYNNDDEELMSFRNGDNAGMQDHQIDSKTVTSFAYKGIHIHVYKHMTLDR